MTKRIELELFKDHKHGGKDFPPGSIIQVTPQQADRLEEKRIGQRTDHPSRRQRKKPKEDRKPELVPGPLD